MMPSLRTLTLALSAVLVLALGPAALAVGGGEVIEVNSLADLPDADTGDGVCDADLEEPGLQCTLRAAIMHLNASDVEGVGVPQIMLPEGTFKLKLKGSDEDDGAFGDLDIKVPMEIIGEGWNVTIVDGGGAKDRVFDVFAEAAFFDLTIQKGKAVPDSKSPEGRGGGIRAGADVTLDGVVVTKCSAPEDGGAITVGVGTTLTVNRSLFIKNKAKGDGAAIDLDSATLIVTDSTFEGNKASSEGGAIKGSSATIELTNVTMFKNKAKVRGGAIILETTGTTTLLNCTLAGNKAKQDANLGVDLELIEGPGVQYIVENTILFAKGNKLGNCAVAVTSSGGNIDSGDSCGLGGSNGNGDLVNTDPRLAKKAADNGGAPVKTVALEADSPAIDFANDGSCPPQDARGVDRVDVPGVGTSICDSGAYEFAPPPEPTQPPTADAGPDQEVSDTDLGGDEMVTLDGSGSSDPDGTIESYVWTEDGGEIATGETPIVTLDVGAHTIVLTVTDDDMQTDTDTVVITVLAGGANQDPTADAGPDQMVTDTDMGGDELVTLDGSGSSDPDGSIDTYVWSENGGQIATGMTPDVTLAVGNHTITLTVTDDEGGMDTDTVVIMVEAGLAAISWAADLQPYFDTNCTSCHNSGFAQQGAMLDSWANMLAGGDNGALVVPFDSTQGLLVPQLESGHQGAPHGTNIVADLESWIDAGALDN